MPFVPHQIGGDAPKVAHLGVVTDESGEVLALPPGAVFYIIEDATNPQKLFPMVLLRVNRKKLVFQCPCGKPECNRVYEYTLSRGLGHHFSEANRSEALVKRQLNK